MGIREPLPIAAPTACFQLFLNLLMTSNMPMNMHMRMHTGSLTLIYNALIALAAVRRVESCWTQTSTPTTLSLQKAQMAAARWELRSCNLLIVIFVVSRYTIYDVHIVSVQHGKGVEPDVCVQPG